MSLETSLAQAAPIYNLGFVIIIILLFIKLFQTPIKDRRVYLKPWKIIFFAIIVFIVEEGLTVLRMADIITPPIYTYGLFEILIICTFIYMLLLQKERLKRTKA